MEFLFQHGYYCECKYNNRQLKQVIGKSLSSKVSSVSIGELIRLTFAVISARVLIN